MGVTDYVRDIYCTSSSVVVTPPPVFFKPYDTKNDALQSYLRSHYHMEFSTREANTSDTVRYYGGYGFI